MTVRIAVLQPSYLPWLGYFDQIARTDAFILYDDVQFDKNGWRNRNRIRVPNKDGWMWLTVPVNLSGNFGVRVKDVSIVNDQPWARKHLGSLKQYYAKARYFKEYFPFFEEIYSRSWTSLCDLNIEILMGLCSLIGLEARFYRSSELGIEGERAERLARICEYFGAKEYLTGDAAADYLATTDVFQKRGIQVIYQRYPHPIYPQCFEPFVPYLSIVDLLMNVGPASLKVLDSEKRPRSNVALPPGGMQVFR